MAKHAKRKPIPMAHIVETPIAYDGRDALAADLRRRLVESGVAALYTDNVSGAGKTAVASMLLNEDAFTDRFPDGLLWARLGPTPDLVGVLNRWADALEVDTAGTFQMDDRRERIRTALADRRCLLILDDACSAEVIDTLRIGGPACSHFLTTRNPALATAFAGDNAVPLPPLDSAAALALFRRHSADATAIDPGLANELCALVGYMPLPILILAKYVDGEWAEELELQGVGSPEQRLRQLAMQLRGKAAGGSVTLRQVLTIILHLLPKALQAGFYAHGALAPKPALFHEEVQQALLADNEDAFLGLLPLHVVDYDYGTEEMLWLNPAVAEVARTRTQNRDFVRVEEYYLASLDEDRRSWEWIEDEVYGQVCHIMRRVANNPARLVPWVVRLIGYWGRRGISAEAEAWARQALAAALANPTASPDHERLTEYTGLLFLALADWKAAAAFFATFLPEQGDESLEPGPAFDADLLRTWQPFLFRSVGAMFRIEPDRAWFKANTDSLIADREWRGFVKWARKLVARQPAPDEPAEHRSARWLARIIYDLVFCQWDRPIENL